MPLAGTVILLLATSLSVTVDAQDGTDPMAPAYFTYTTELVEESPRGNPMVLRDHQQVVAVEATDPRASGLMTITYNWNTVVLGDEWQVITTAMSERLTNEGGAWTGTGRGVMSGGEAMMMTGMDVLTGEGGYEGLTLVIGQFMRAGVTDTNWGFILPSDQVPPMPEPPEPPAE
jgi:hypothetical protein